MTAARRARAAAAAAAALAAALGGALGAAAPAAAAGGFEAGGALDPWTLFLSAGAVVKGVILVLAAASVWTWAVIASKAAQLRRARRACARFEAEFWSGVELEALFDRVGASPPGPSAAVFAAAMREWQRVPLPRPESRLMERIDRVMALAAARELERLERGIGSLASVASAAPFVGLLGTVWGIMTSFAAIAAEADTSLAVVAPGIAEALFATALGLVAAIPAVLGHNRAAEGARRAADRLEAFADEISTLLSRNLEGRGGPR